MTEKSFTVNLKVKYENDGSFINARLLKGKSSIGEDLLGKINVNAVLNDQSSDFSDGDLSRLFGITIDELATPSPRAKSKPRI